MAGNQFELTKSLNRYAATQGSYHRAPAMRRSPGSRSEVCTQIQAVCLSDHSAPRSRRDHCICNNIVTESQSIPRVKQLVACPRAMSESLLCPGTQTTPLRILAFFLNRLSGRIDARKQQAAIGGTTPRQEKLQIVQIAACKGVSRVLALPKSTYGTLGGSMALGAGKSMYRQLRRKWQN